jgi:hypothetical protein
MQKRKLTEWLLAISITILVFMLVFLNSNQENKEKLTNDNLKLENYLKNNSKKGNSYYCKYNHVYDGSYNRKPNSQQYIYLKIEHGILLLSGSERSVIDAWNLPFKYIFDEKSKLLTSKGIVKYYIENNRKIIIGNNPENHVGPIRSPIKNMPYELSINFEHYPMYLDYFYVDLDAISEDGNLKIRLSCKN